MLKIHTELAEQCGVPLDHSFIMQNGDVLALSKDNARMAGHFQAGDVYIDGSGIGDIGSIVLRDRQLLSEEGIVVVVATINLHGQEIQSGPDILSRGFVYMRESGELLDEGRRRVFKTIRKAMHGKKATESSIRNAVIDDLQEFLYDKTERHPMILPMLIMNNNH